MKTFDCTFEIGYEMVNASGLVKPRSLVELLLETAIKNCLAVNYGVFDMLKDNLGWVLRGGEYIVHRMPKYAEKIKIKTWISKWSLFQGVREFIITDVNDKIIVSCTSNWAMIDLIKRIPTEIVDVFKNKWCFNDHKAVDSPLIKKPLEIKEIIAKKDFKVLRRDMDSNMHVHNLSYIDWVFETLPVCCTKSRILKFSGAYLKEISGQETIRCIVGRTQNGEFVHNVTSADEKIIYATGMTSYDENTLLTK